MVVDENMTRIFSHLGLSRRDVKRIVKADGDISDIEKYDPRFSLKTRVELLVKRITPAAASKLLQRMPSGYIEEYDQRFSLKTRIELFIREIHPCGAEMLLKYFSLDDIEHYLEGRRNRGPLAAYLLEFSLSDILILHETTHESLSFEDQKRLYPLLRRFCDHGSIDTSHLFVSKHDLSKMTIDDFTLIACGKNSFVVLAKLHRYAYKFAPEVSHEEELLRRLHRDGDPNKTRNIVRLLRHIDPQVVRLEYIEGKTLEEHIRSNPGYDPVQVLNYSSQIVDALICLRSAGIYHHRDLRPTNIMVDEENDRIVIIDLGIATTEKEFFPRDNRRYGGPNDLVSLGQIMYKLATGEHVFADSESMEKTIYAEQLRDHRDWIYEKPGERLPPHLERLQKISDRKIQDAIYLCLTSATSNPSDNDYLDIQRKLRHRLIRRKYFL